jgi:Protein of Unknown function (DUF2784)
MLARFAADSILVFHGLFIMFAVFGAALALWRNWIVALHLPSAAWAAMVVGFGWICPLTPIEQSLRRVAGQAGYTGSFIEHYLLNAIYPPGLTRNVQIALGVSVVVVNVLLYWCVWRRHDRK